MEKIILVEDHDLATQKKDEYQVRGKTPMMQTKNALLVQLHLSM